jgi:hypothetical protein
MCVYHHTNETAGIMIVCGHGIENDEPNLALCPHQHDNISQDDIEQVLCFDSLLSPSYHAYIITSSVALMYIFNAYVWGTIGMQPTDSLVHVPRLQLPFDCDYDHL